LRAIYGALAADPEVECLTMSEAIARTPHGHYGRLEHLVPGSWINSNFNVWIGAPEDNRSWDHLSAARDFFAERSNSSDISADKRQLALEELLISEGSDWNWWYGPEHHSANDPEFDALYRQHLSNIYQTLGAAPPEALAQPIFTGKGAVKFNEQTAFIHPQIDGEHFGYFDWLGAAHYVADRRNSAMHGKRFVLHSAYAGIDDENLYCRLDFADEVLDESEDLRGDFMFTVTIEKVSIADNEDREKHQLDVQVTEGKLQSWRLHRADTSNGNGTASNSSADLEVRLSKVLEARISLQRLQASIGNILQLRFSAWENNLPADALPEQGSIAVRVVTEQELSKVATGEHWNA
jgi:hypothetical protein